MEREITAASGDKARQQLLTCAAAISDVSRELSLVPTAGKNSQGYKKFFTTHVGNLAKYNKEVAAWGTLKNDLPGWKPINSRQASDVAESVEELDLGIAPVVVALIIAGIISSLIILVPLVQAEYLKIKTWRENSEWQREQGIDPTPLPENVLGFSTTQLLIAGAFGFGVLLLTRMK